MEKTEEQVEIEFRDFIAPFRNEKGLPIIPKDKWIEFRDQYEPKVLRKVFASVMAKDKVPFPFKEYTFDDVYDTFEKLRGYNKDFITDISDVDERYDFKYKYYMQPLGLIPTSGGKYNAVSDNYQQANRMNVGSVHHIAPYVSWTTGEKMTGKNTVIWNDKLYEDFVDGSAYRAMFRLTYLCSQFKPDVAKFIYYHTKSKKILDLSCGWGDRLAGFYATSDADEYIGCDPNGAVYEVYKQQCLDYEKFLGHKATITEYNDYFECRGSKFVRIYNLPAEDVDWKQYESYFDLIFTSPPYFDLEKYDETNENQSWIRYDTFDRWKNDFLFKVIELTVPTLNNNGCYMINITEPKDKKKSTEHKLCDSMVDYVKSLDDMFYIGKIGMLLSTRIPAKGFEETKSKTIEPIWCFRKGSDQSLDKKQFDVLFEIL
jgi:DNA methylase